MEIIFGLHSMLCKWTILNNSAAVHPPSYLGLHRQPASPGRLLRMPFSWMPSLLQGPGWPGSWGRRGGGQVLCRTCSHHVPAVTRGLSRAFMEQNSGATNEPLSVHLPVVETLYRERVGPSQASCGSPHSAEFDRSPC